MKAYSNVYIGIVDILGYTDLESRLNRLGEEPSTELLSRMFNFLEGTINKFNDSHITWIRYGDGYVIYSHKNNIDSLSKIIKDCCYLISIALTQTIPLRIAITQGNIKIDNPPDGLTVSGNGWSELINLEQALNWMGGFLYLSIFDGTHSNIIKELIQTTHLVKQQNNSLNNQHFKAPFKEGKETNKKNSWFLNWHKLLHLPKEGLDQQIKNWWGSFPFSLNNNKEVKEKQKNSIDFADYCRLLYEAANLIFYSEIDRKINIGKIDSYK